MGTEVRTFRIITYYKQVQRAVPAWSLFWRLSCITDISGADAQLSFCSRAALPTQVPAALCVEMGRQKEEAEPEGDVGKCQFLSGL